MLYYNRIYLGEWIDLTNKENTKKMQTLSLFKF